MWRRPGTSPVVKRSPFGEPLSVLFPGSPLGSKWEHIHQLPNSSLTNIQELCCLQGGSQDSPCPKMHSGSRGSEASSAYLTRSIIKVLRFWLSTKQLLLTSDLLQTTQHHVIRRTVGVIPIPNEERREATKHVSVWSTDHRLITLLKMQISWPHYIGRWNSTPQ